MLDDGVLLQLVRSQVGPGVRVWRHDRGNASPMSLVLDVVDEVLERRCAVFWADGGPPEMFTLPDLDPAVVLFSVRHLEMTGYLRGVVMDEVLGEDLREDLAEQVSLRMIAELVLRYGDPGLACHLLAESISDAGPYAQPLTLMDLELEPISEMYLAVWFFALLHELGHIASTGHADNAEFDPYIDGLVEAVTRERFGDRHDELMRNLRPPGRPDSLDRPLLREEIAADLFSVQVLIFAAARVMKRKGTPFDITKLSTEIVLLFGLFHYVNSCALAARIGSGRRGDLPDVLGNAANDVRINVIIDFLAGYLATGGQLGSADKQEQAQETIRDYLFVAYEQTNEQLAPFDRGHARALRHCYFPDERRLDAIGRLAAELDSASGIAARLEVQRFLAMSEALQVKHRDLELLATFIAEPGGATQALGRQQLRYLVPWVSGDDVEMPFGLIGRDAYVVFVFFSDDLAGAFVEESLTVLRPGYELHLTTVISPTEQNVVITAAQRVPADARKRLQVVFEGTRAFDDRFQQLDDGSFWPAES
ncbi:MAG TPA: hypothetical protein VFB74_32940 [Kribbellaceae bacterium]|nr:hypothetical protein [Kribbellaceae bacterium]